jgi:hypothetical protein
MLALGIVVAFLIWASTELMRKDRLLLGITVALVALLGVAALFLY